MRAAGPGPAKEGSATMRKGKALAAAHFIRRVAARCIGRMARLDVRRPCGNVGALARVPWRGGRIHHIVEPHETACLV